LISSLNIVFTTPVRAQFVDTAKFKYLGVNIPNLQTYDEAKMRRSFEYLQHCNVNTVRTFGLQKAPRNGVADLATAQRLASEYGIKLVVALDDYAGGSDTLPNQQVHPNPPEWYNINGSLSYVSTGHRNMIQSSVAVLQSFPGVAVVEAANEPHCGRFPGCLPYYKSWLSDISSMLAGTGKIVSPGTAMIGAVDSPGEGFEEINALPSIQQASVHWYPETMPGKEPQFQEAARIAQSLNKEILLGEIGFSCNGVDNCMSSTNDEIRAGWLAKVLQMFGEWEYDGVLYWTFGGFRSGFDYYAENDNHSWFPDNPTAYEDPFCKSFRGEIEPREFDFGSALASESAKKPLFIFPKEENTTEWNKYFANSQVYCAPTQINWPSFDGQDQSLAPCEEVTDEDADPLAQQAVLRDGVCTATEYPVVDYSETYKLQNFSLPLFRDENGDISIESDLSRVNPDDTFFEAVQSNRRPGYAPQFFLTSPQQQCFNASRYIQYVNDLCDKYGSAAEECPAKEPIHVKGGHTIEWDVATNFITAEVCRNFTEEMKEDSLAAQLVRGVETYTPKAYKMGFLVQHNTLFDRNNLLIGGQYLSNMIASWLKGEEPHPVTREKLVVVPIWYQSGIMTNEYSPDQTAAYPIDPETVNPDEITANTDNFIGPFWETYGAVLPTHVQEKIVKKKASIVKDTYRLMTDPFDKLFGTLQKTEVTFLGETSVADVIVSCDEGLCIPCADGTCEADETEKLEELRQSFPDDFQPSDQFLKELLRLIVVRINTGVQKTKPYDSEDWSSGAPGPSSQRSFEPCPVDQNNTRYGESEQSEGIGYKALQKLTNSKDSTTLGKAINTISSLFTAKILWDRQPYQAQFPKSRSYLILPDESIDIDIAESYITSMFLSPQMYDSIMKGENPIYPWKEENPDTEFVSAFLRTSDYDREHSSEKKGYAKYKKTTRVYGATCSLPAEETVSYPMSTAAPQPDCSCSSVVTGGPYEEVTDWIPYPQETENQSPKPENGCQEIQYTVDEKNLVNVIGAETGEDPESNIEVPGKTLALHEFLRRMAFTPHYLIQKYTGLEDFYGGGTALELKAKTKAKLEDLSDYFRELITNLPKTYSDEIPANMCGVVFVDQSAAEKYGDIMSDLFSSQNFVDYLNDGQDLAFLGDCAGASCIDFVIDTATSTPVGDGNYYLNPLAILSTVLMENGRMREGIEWHYSCNVTAFTSYNADASVDGRVDIYDTCVAGDAERDIAANKQNTYIDGFGCYISVMQSQFRQGSNDREAYSSYGYGDPGMMFYQRLQEMATEYKNHAGSEYRQEVELGIRSASEEMLSNMSGCSD